MRRTVVAAACVVAGVLAAALPRAEAATSGFGSLSLFSGWPAGAVATTEPASLLVLGVVLAGAAHGIRKANQAPADVSVGASSKPGRPQPLS